MADTDNHHDHDVIIIGSGAGGGTVAHVLTKAGLRCLMIEAGSWYDTAAESKMLASNYDAPHLGMPIDGRPAFDSSHGGWQLPGEPYSNAPDSRFRWFRSRMLGGRTNHFGRIWLRMGQYDFKPRKWDGKGADWPIDYADIAPYYDKSEELVGVFGSDVSRVNEPAGRFQPPPEPRCVDRYLMKMMGPLGVPVMPISRAILTQPLGDRPACHYCGQCYRGCSVSANLSSPTVLLPPAIATGRLKIQCDAMVREIVLDQSGRATGVSYIDKRTRTLRTARASIIVVAAGACESARLLLNSRPPERDVSLGNGYGQVGKYLLDTVCHVTIAHIPALAAMPAHNCDGANGTHVYIPWWNYERQRRGELPFTRGYQTLFLAGRQMPNPAMIAQGVGEIIDGYGLQLKRDVRRFYGSTAIFSSGGDMIPNNDSFVEINTAQLDEWGIPTLRFHFRWGADELRQAEHAGETYRGFVTHMGGQVLTELSSTNDAGPGFHGGAMYHEVGTVRMGNNPRSSALDPYCRVWESPNVFVADGAPFVSNSSKNPTSTIMALAWRTADNIVDRKRAGEL